MNSEVLIGALGWSLVHFVWQGAVLAGAVALVLHLLRGASAQVRYVVACCGLASMLVLPLLTGLTLYGAGPPPPKRVEQASHAPPGLTLTAVLGESAALGQTASQRGGAASAFVERTLRWLVLAWAVGVLLLSLRTLAGWRVVARLGASGEPAPRAWRRRLAELSLEVGATARVRLRVSPSAAVPMVLGWLRPVILLPPSALTGLTPRQLEAVLLHELAHIRRYDPFVNAVQIAVEILLFYNPAVWWLSARIRTEREHCCDAAAAARSGGARRYAEALLRLEEQRRAPALAVAVTGGSLLPRVRRLLVPPPRPHAGAYWAAALLLATCFATAATLHARLPPAMRHAAVPTADAAAIPPAVYIVVEAGENGVEHAVALAAALGLHEVQAVYTASDRRTLAAAEPLADLLGAARIPYDFGSEPERFARHLVSGSLLANTGRVAVAVLPPALVGSFVAHASGGRVPDRQLAPGEVFVVEIPGGVTRVRIDG